MGNSEYLAQIVSGNIGSNSSLTGSPKTFTSTTMRFAIINDAATAFDRGYVGVSIYGDLA
jgi:hypothetical protein